MHPELNRIMNIAREILGDRCKIEIVTNGLLIPMLPDDILSSIRDNNIIVNISFYEDTKNHIDEILSKLGDRVWYCFNDESIHDRTIIDRFCTMLTNEKRETSPQRECYGKRCHFLRDYKLYKCVYPGLISVVNEKFNEKFSVDKLDYIELASDNIQFWHELERIEGHVPFCYYCTDDIYWFEWESKRAEKGEQNYYVNKTNSYKVH